MTPSLIFDLDPDELLPEEHASYRPLVRDAFMFFLQRLPSSRMLEIVSAQTRLPSGASMARRLFTVFSQCPTLHKLGQMLARDERLAPALRAQLQQLESFAPTVDVSELAPAIDCAFGDASGITLADKALAEASVAVVVPFTWQEHPDAEPVRGVLKVLKPDIRARLDQELNAWSELGAYVEQRSEHYGLPGLDYREIVDGISQRLRQEVALAHEQAHLKEAARLYANAPDIRVPMLMPFCTDEVTAMTQIDGVKLTDAPSLQKARALTLLIDALIARPLLGGDDRTPFHADPHPGNLLLTDDGALGVLDWSLVVRLNETERGALKRILRSALGHDDAGVARGLEDMCTQRSSSNEILQMARASIRQLRRGALPGLRWITETIDRAVMEARIRVSDDLVLLRKALHTLKGVAGELSSVSAIDSALIARATRQYFSDTAGAVINPASPSSSRVAGVNAALFGIWMDAPAAASRYWLGVWKDLLADQRT